MKIEVTETDRKKAIWILSISLCLSLLVNFSHKEKKESDRFLHYGMADEGINYQIIYDQEEDTKVVYPELLSEDDTLYIDGYTYVKRDSVEITEKKSVIYLEER